MDKMEIWGVKYQVIGSVESKRHGTVPLLDIPMMSDETWMKLAQENAVDRYRRAFGREPESVEVAVDWVRKLEETA